MATFAYVVLIALAGLLTYASCWIAAAACALLAFVIAMRFEVRWLLDHTPLTRYSQPRPVPPPRKS